MACTVVFQTVPCAPADWAASSVTSGATGSTIAPANTDRSKLPDLALTVRS
ncbi:MAG: hypothetical protein QOG45_1655 [Chloroflexota bacterium]|nr:hypothetical protein [Chloroflexota bacterium]